MSEGSSPLARGLPLDRDIDQAIVRIIPARAGFTVSVDPVQDLGQDHPRSRGVYRSRGGVVICCSGSSPLARGLHTGAGPVPDPRRIIPARAGFTQPGARGARAEGDHPRSRGVYTISLYAAVTMMGSSPLARGLHQYHDTHPR